MMNPKPTHHDALTTIPVADARAGRLAALSAALSAALPAVLSAALPAVLSASIGLLAGPATAQSLDLDQAIERHREVMKRKPFRFHAHARERLARTRDVKALEILIADYEKPKSYDHYTRYTIASLFGECFDDWVWAEKFQALRSKHDDPEDVWLWINTAAVDGRDEGRAATLRAARETKDLVLKAAILHSMGYRGYDEALELISELCADFPSERKHGERRLLVGAMSTAILGNKNDLGRPAMQKAIRAYINLLHEDVKLTHSTKMVIARHLSKTIGKDSLYIDPDAWIQLLDRNYEAPKRSGQTVTTMRFFGIEAEGDRLCYLVDLSNSMLKPIDPALTKQGPTTGPRPPRKKGQLPDENDIPWHKVKTRFDLAREHLKISIQRLDKDKHFCVVWFGDSAGTLESTPKMIRATYGNVKKVMEELDDMRAKPAPPQLAQDAPHGVLKGQTNMHAGLRFAFGLHSRGVAKDYEYIDMKAMADGCDTIFLLSDGAPSVDDFMVKDKDYGEGKVVRELEYAREVERPETIVYYGPMNETRWLRREVSRFNVFRKAQIHCIGVGEADIGLLRELAAEGDGEVYLFGREAKASNGGRSR